MTPRSARITRWRGPLPELGHYLRTAKGTTYLILSFAPNERTNRKSIGSVKLLKLSQDDIRDIPEDALIHPFQWD